MCCSILGIATLPQILCKSVILCCDIAIMVMEMQHYINPQTKTSEWAKNLKITKKCHKPLLSLLHTEFAKGVLCTAKKTFFFWRYTTPPCLPQCGNGLMFRDRIINSHFAGKLNSFNMGGRGNGRFKIAANVRTNVRTFLLAPLALPALPRAVPRSPPDVSPQSKFQTRWVVDRGKGNVGVQTGKDCLLTCHGRYLGRRCEKSLIVGGQTCDLHCVKRAWLMHGVGCVPSPREPPSCGGEMADMHSTHVYI